MICKRPGLWAVAVALVLTTGAIHAAETYEVTLERGVTAKMRDGVILRADIYRPKADGQFPVLLQRTPYDKRKEIAGVRFQGGVTWLRRHHSGCAGTLHPPDGDVHVQARI